MFEGVLKVGKFDVLDGQAVEQGRKGIEIGDFRPHVDPLCCDEVPRTSAPRTGNIVLQVEKVTFLEGRNRGGVAHTLSAMRGSTRWKNRQAKRKTARASAVDQAKANGSVS